MLDRLPLELALDIVNYEVSPWARADLLNCLCALTRRYRAFFLPYRQSYLVIQSPRALQAVQSWSETQRRIVRIVLARSWSNEQQAIVEELDARHKRGEVDATGTRVNTKGLPIDKYAWESVSLAEVVQIMHLLPSVDTFRARNLGHEGVFLPKRPLVIDMSYDSPFHRCRTLVIENTQTHWFLHSAVPPALQHLAIAHAAGSTPPGLNLVFQNGVFRNLKTLRLCCAELPSIPISFLNRLEAIQIDQPTSMSSIPFLYYETKTPVLFNLASLPKDSTQIPTRDYASVAFRFAPSTDQDLIGALDLVRKFPLAWAVFLVPTSCACQPKNIAAHTCPLMSLTFGLRHLGVPLLRTKPSESTDEIEPEFLNVVRRNKRVLGRAA